MNLFLFYKENLTTEKCHYNFAKQSRKEIQIYNEDFQKKVVNEERLALS